MNLDWDNAIKHEHPNIFLRVYGNCMMKIADFFMKLGMKYSTTFEIPQLEDDDNDIDFDELEFEFSLWSPKRHV